MDKAKDLEEQRLMKLLKSTFEGGFMLGCRIAGRAAPFPTTEMEATWKALESTSSDGVRVILDAVRKAGPPWSTFAVTRKAAKADPLVFLRTDTGISTLPLPNPLALIERRWNDRPGA
jgi:hypothetical protein